MILMLSLIYIGFVDSSSSTTVMIIVIQYTRNIKQEQGKKEGWNFVDYFSFLRRRRRKKTTRRHF